MEDLSGQTLGPYTLLNRIGMGGMASVYRAYQANMDRYVAIKVLPREFAEDPGFVGRFQQEARIIAKLEHRHILPVYDYGEDAGITYLVMRFVDGGTLKDLVRGVGIDPQDALRLVAQVADALDQAHRQGVVHRDVKPSNVLLDRDGDAYLTDFGIARLAESVSQFTGSGQLIGTPFYMSPEQCRGNPADPRSDIYSLGIMLYELVTGRLPFEAETPIAVVLMHIQDPLPPPRAVNASIPEAVERIILQATAKAPDDRFQTAGDMAVALRLVLATAASGGVAGVSADRIPPEAGIEVPPSATQRQPSAPLPAWQRMKPLLLGGTVLAMLVLAIALTLLVLSGRQPGESQVTASVGDTREALTQTATGAAGQAATESTADVAGGGSFAFAPPQQWSQITNTEDIYDAAYRDGAVWAATAGGLVRWTVQDQGYTKYTTADGLPFSALRSLVFDNSGALWLAHQEDGGLARVTFDPAGAVATVEVLNPAGDTVLYVSDLLQTEEGLIVSAYGPELWLWNGETWRTLSPPPRDMGEYPYTIGMVEGALWVSLDGGLLAWTGDRWSQISLPGLEAGEVVLMVYEDSVGRLWIGTDSKTLLFVWDKGEFLPHGSPLRDGAIETMVETEVGTLWVAGPGLVAVADASTVDAGAWQWFDDLPGWERRALIEDGDGHVWVATDAGMLRYDGSHWEQHVVPGEPPDHDFADIVVGPDGEFWLPVLYSGRVVRFSPETGMWASEIELEAEVRALVVMGDTLWLGTDAGLIRRRAGAQRRFLVEDGLVDDKVNALSVDPDDAGVLWIGTDGGLSRFDTTSEAWMNLSGEAMGLPCDTVTLLYGAPGGQVWAASGSEDGDSGDHAALSVFDGQGWTLIGALGAPFDVDAHRILAMTADARGNLWVSTDGGGVHRWDGARWRTHYSADGAPEEWVLAMLNAPDSSIWMSADEDGLYRFDEADGWSHISQQDLGWWGTPQKMFISPDGELWLLTWEGAVRFRP